MGDASAELEQVRASLLRHYGIEASEINLLDAGSTPNHYVLASTGAPYLVKALRSRLGSWVADNARQITTLAAHVASHGLATPAPVRTTDGGLVAVEPGPREAEETHLVVFEWASGFQRADSFLAQQPSAAADVMAKLGELLACLHGLPLPAECTLVAPEAPGGHALCDMGSFLSHVDNPDALFPSQSSADALWFRDQLSKVADLWARMPAERAFCHGDPYLDNVLVKPEGPLLLVDWEDSCATNPIVDVAACAVGTCFTLTLREEEGESAPVELVQERLRSLLKGYQSKRPLQSQERALLRPAMQACAWACGAFRYGRFLEGVTDVKTLRYGQLREVVELLEGLGSGFEAVAFC